MVDSPRFQLLIARYGRRLAVALAVVGALLLLVSGWIALTPSTSTATEQTDPQRIATSAETSAVVTGDDSLWEQGTVLRDNPVYLTNATPELDVTSRTSVPSDSSAEVTHDLRLRIEAERDGSVIWSDTEVLLRENQTVENGTAVSRATIDVPELRTRLARLQQQFAGVGSVEARIELTTDYNTGRETGQLQSSTRLEVTDRAYWLEGDIADSRKHTVPTTRQVTHSPNWAVVLPTALLGLLALTAAWTVFATRPEDLDVDAIRQELHRRKYDEWISTGSIPMWVGQNYVELDTLEGVVDVAIDTKERVVHDTRRDLFAVISGDVVYYYSRSGDWDQASWPRMDLPSGEDTVDVGESSDDLGDLPGPDELSDSGEDPEDWDDDAWRDL